MKGQKEEMTNPEIRFYATKYSNYSMSFHDLRDNLISHDVEKHCRRNVEECSTVECLRAGNTQTCV